MEQVFKSDYLQGRKRNHALYARLISAIKKTCAGHLKESPSLEIKLSMSAKYQTPTIVIKDNEQVPSAIGAIEADIIDALAQVGFEYEDGEDKGHGYYVISFAD